MRYAITGATGFIGTALANRLVQDGHSVTPVPRASMDNANSFAHFIDWSNPDCIIHCAAYGNHYSQKDIEQTIRTNTIGTLNVFIGAKGRKVYNFTSSSITLTHQTPYSITKKAAADIASLYDNVINVMPYSVYGPGEAAHRFIPTVIGALLDGRQIDLDESATHDWILVEDFVTAFLNGHTVIGTGKKYTNLEIVRKLEMITGKKLNYRKAKLRNYDNPDWVAPAGVDHVSIEEGLLKTFMHYRELTKKIFY